MTLKVSESERIDDASCRSVASQGESLRDLELFTVDGKRRVVESVPGYRASDAWWATSPSNGDVDGFWDLVGQPVICQGACQADGGVRCSSCDLDEVRVSLGACLQEQSASKWLDQALVTPGVQATIRHTEPSAVRAREDARKLVEGGCFGHVSKCSQVWVVWLRLFPHQPVG